MPSFRESPVGPRRPLLSLRHAQCVEWVRDWQASGFDYDLSDITCPTFTIAGASFTTAPPDHVTINLAGLNMACGANYWYKPHGWSNVFKEKGRCDLVSTYPALSNRPYACCMARYVCGNSPL